MTMEIDLRFSKIKILIKIVKMKLTIKKIWNRFNDPVSHKIDFTAYGLNIDNPPAWELIYSDQF